MDLKKAFETALEFERRGHIIYKETAGKTQNPFVKKTFAYLSEQEINHIEEIRKYIAEAHPETANIELRGDTLEGVRTFFATTTKDFRKKTELSSDDIKAHETGMHLEKSAYEFYKKEFEKTPTKDAKLKAFFKFLMDQENAHYLLIQNALNFIKAPEHFYSEEERWIVEG